MRAGITHAVTAIMTEHVALHHATTYRFDRPVILSAHEIRLKPAAHSRTPVSAYTLTVEPALNRIHQQQDVYGNFVARVSFPEPTDILRITVDLLAELDNIDPFDFFVETWAERMPFSYPANMKIGLSPFLLTEPQGLHFERWRSQIRQELSGSVGSIEYLVRTNQALAEKITYQLRYEHGVQTPEATLEQLSGSCRDSAWLLVQTLRQAGIAARFVSGYLIQFAALPAGATDAETAGLADLHAWCEAFIPGAGWIGLDATSGLLTGTGHIPLAVAAIPESTAPVSGHTAPCTSRFDVCMTAHLTNRTAQDSHA